ncbi:T9SS type B sorting domain-containing protein, partial [Flavobacterium sp.]|uniref:T9SS type B sorting domain-containing protein n=1 Tax=Flavobacterium sp. TaxID=239 RepID=UPI0037538E51
TTTTTVYSLVSSATSVVSPTPSCSQAQSGTATITTLPLPSIGTMTDYYSCKILSTGLAPFNLSTKNVEALAGQNSSQFIVSYHLLQNEALNGLNPLPTLYNSISTSIWVSVKNNTTGCRSLSPLTLIAETATFAFQPTVLQSTICDEFNDNDGYAQYNLESFNSIILGTQFGIPDYQIQYFLSISDLNTNNPISNLNTFENTSNPQPIYVKVINNNTVNKCEAITSFNLRVTLLPEPTPKDGAVCFDQITGSLLSNYIIDSGLSASTHTFEWYLNSSTTPILGATNSNYEVSLPGNYFVVATSNLAPFCVSKPKLSVVIKSEPAIATVRVEYSFNENIQVIVNPKGIGQYRYQIDDEISQLSSIFINVQPGTHKITIIDENGCADFILEVIVLDYVKFFTPNGDNYNDYWNIKGIKDQPNAKIFLYDRYGKFLKQLSPESLGWDGTYRGYELPSDDYWFTVFYVENGEDKVFKSHFSMKR